MRLGCAYDNRRGGWSVCVIEMIMWLEKTSMFEEVRSGAVMARSSGISWGCASAMVSLQRWR
jgi:hypothetical protein